MTKIEQAAELLADVDHMALTAESINASAHTVGITVVNKWHADRIRNARYAIETERLLGRRA